MKQTLWVDLRDSEAIRDFAYLILSRSIISASFILFTCFQRRQAPNSEMKVTQEKDKRLFTITKRKEEALLKLHQIFAKEQALIETTFHMRLTEHELLAQQWTTQAEKIAFERRIQEQEKDEKHEKHKMIRQMTLAEQMLQEQADNLQSRNSFAVQSYKFMFDFETKLESRHILVHDLIWEFRWALMFRSLKLVEPQVAIDCPTYSKHDTSLD